MCVRMVCGGGGWGGVCVCVCVVVVVGGGGLWCVCGWRGGGQEAACWHEGLVQCKSAGIK